jgi:ketosteroid isomerase-like protein
MRCSRGLLVVVLSLVSAVPGFCASRIEGAPPSSSAAQSAEEEVLAVERSRGEAIRTHDREALARIYADDFSGVTTAGKKVDKETVIQVLANVDPQLTFTTEDLTARLFGEAAVVSGRVTGHGTIDGREISNAFWFLHIYVHRAARWELVAGESTNIAP